MRRLALPCFLLLVLGGGLAIGTITRPGEWYAQLAKPAFNPPNWVFGPAWTTLYILIALAGWRTWRRDRTSTPMRLWWVQLAFNFAWSPVFFGAQRIGFALVIALLMLASVLAFIAASWKHDRVAAWLFVPYAAWVSFASALNAAILRLN